LAAGASVHHTDEHGNTALHVAAACGHTRAVMMLLQHGADKRVRDALSKTAVQLAREGIKSKKKFCQTFGLPYNDADAELCVQLLK
jgi:hypothetical protein